MKKFKSNEHIVVGIDKLVLAFHQANVDMSQNIFRSSKDHDYIKKVFDSMGISIHDELITLNLMVEKSSQPTLLVIML